MATTTRPVLRTEVRNVSSSRGRIVRRSMSSSGRLEAGVDHGAPRDHRHVVSLAGDPGLAHRDEELRIIGHLFLDRAVDPLGLEEDHRVLAPDAGLEQALGVRRRRGDDHLESGRVREVGLRRLAVVVAAADAASIGGADDHGAGELSARPVPHLGHLGHDLVEGREDEVRELDLGHRTQSVEGHPDRRTDDPGFGQGRVEHAVLAEGGLKPLRRAEHAAVQADVLPEEDNVVIALHLLAERRVDGL
jgi:hypothetical protein